MIRQRKGPARKMYGAISRINRRALILTTALLVCPVSAIAQSFNVIDTNGEVVGPLMSDAAISQGVEIEIAFDGAICQVNNPAPCQDGTWLLVPWSQGGSGFENVAYYEQTMPQQDWYFTDPNCESQAYLKVPKVPNSAKHPYDVIGGDSQAGNVYFPELTNKGTAAGLVIVAVEASPLTYYYQPGAPAYTTTGACEPAWVASTDEFALMARADLEDSYLANTNENLGFEPPFSIVDPPKKRHG